MVKYNWIFMEESTMKQRTITAIVLILIVVPLIYFGGWFTVLFSSVFVMGGVYELLKARKDKNWPLPVYIVTFFINSS